MCWHGCSVTKQRTGQYFRSRIAEPCDIRVFCSIRGSCCLKPFRGHHCKLKFLVILAVHFVRWSCYEQERNFQEVQFYSQKIHSLRGFSSWFYIFYNAFFLWIISQETVMTLVGGLFSCFSVFQLHLKDSWRAIFFHHLTIAQNCLA